MDLAGDCCCSRVARLHVLASPGGEARAAASLSPTPPSPSRRTSPHPQAPRCRLVQFVKNKMFSVLYGQGRASGSRGGVVSSSLALCISHPLPIPRGSPCLRARVDVYECRGGKRSVISPRGALNLPAARFLQTKRFDPLPSPKSTDIKPKTF